MLLLILDILIVLLLLITLGAGFRLHRSLLRLQTNNQEFEQLVQSLDTAAKRAESALSGLKQRAEETSSKLNEEANDVQRLLDDLRFMKDHSEQLVDKLEGAIGRARAMALAAADQQPGIRTARPVLGHRRQTCGKRPFGPEAKGGGNLQQAERRSKRRPAAAGRSSLHEGSQRAIGRQARRSHRPGTGAGGETGPPAGDQWRHVTHHGTAGITAI